jgi:hypothetical protein
VRGFLCVGRHSGRHGAVLNFAIPDLGADMQEVIDALIEATSVPGLVIYLVGMALLLGSLAWAGHLDHRRGRGGHLH